MATVKGNEANGPVATIGTSNKPTSNGVKRANSSVKDAHDAVTSKSVHHEESSNSTVTRSQTRERTVKVTRKYHDELTVLTKGTLFKPDSVELFLDFVAADRLRRMPHRGSRWDKILRWAEHFTTQVSILDESVGSFVHNSEETAQLVWASCRILLEMGQQHSYALEKIFGVFYKMSLTLASILRCREHFAIDDVTKDQLAAVYTELLTVVVEITVTYQRRSRSKPSSSAEDLDGIFGRKIDSFFYHRDQVSNTIWTCQLERDVDLGSITVDLTTIRKWLAPQDRTLRLLSTDTMNSRGARDEFTCEWFQTYLLDFSRSSDDLFLITGESGSGKSVLSGWIVERLQRTLGNKSFDVNSVIIDSAIKSEATPLSIIKRLLLQSLEYNVGNVSFYKLLCAALEMSTRSGSATEIEDALWRAFDKSLDVESNIIIVIDGLDQLVGGEAVEIRFLDRLHAVSTKHKTTKSIILSHPLSKKFLKPSRQFSIQPKNVREDLGRFVYRSLASRHHFRDRKEDEKQRIVNRVVDTANGSFILAEYIVQLLRRETTHDGFTNSLNHAPKSIPDAIQRLVSHLDLTKSDTKLILSWLLISERPLGLKEIEALLQVNITSNKRATRAFNVEEIVRTTCGHLIKIRDGIVRFRHTTIRQHLLETSKTGRSPIKLHDAQSDLTYRCLAYISTHLTKKAEISIGVIESTRVDHLFETYHLLEYTVRYWTNHFRSSPMYRHNGKHELTSEFHHVFTGSVLLVQIEGACWESQSSITEALEMDRLALSVRKAVLTETHEAVIQSLIVIAHTYEKISMTFEASEYYYRASKLSQTDISTHSTISSSCAEKYITCTRSTTATTRTETVNRKEEMLKIIITSHKHHHGTSSEATIRYSKILAQLYMEIQETTLAARIYHEVYEACVELYGEFHSETTSVSRSLTMVLQRESRYEDVLVYVKSLYWKSLKTMEVTDIRRIQITLHLVGIYEAHKELTKAEELIVTLWRQIAIACHTKRTVEVHERKIEVTLAYVKFLRRHSRYSEAENLLRGLWIEYETEDIHSESLIIWIKAIGEELNELRILDVAVTVFKAVWGFFKKIHKQHTVEATSVAISIAEITIEIQSQEESYTEESTYTSEMILKEVFESTISTKTTTQVTTSTVRTCDTLSSFYVRRERWSEAIGVCHRVLKSLWPSFESGGGRTSLPKGFTVESIDMAIRIAHCHLHEGQIEKAETIFVRVFRATKSRLRIDDEQVSRSSKELILFYESTKQSERAIDVYLELWEEYSDTLGKTHTLTLEVLYRLADLSVKYGRKDAKDYYLKIYTNLNHGSDFCHHGAIEAALALTRIYESEKRWTDAQKIYSCLWKTVVTRTKEYDITSERVDEIYRRYFYVLEKEVKVQYSELRQITIEFREVCIKVYGARAEITLRATFRLAEINEQREEHVHEAIEIYEETFNESHTFTKTTTITTIIAAAKSRLTRILITHSSSSTEYTSKAVTLYMEQFESRKTQYGCSHQITLTTLEELAGFYKKQSDQKLQSTLLQTLKGAIVEIVMKEKDSRKLFDSSTRLARIYIAQGYTNEAYQLLEELRRQVVSRDTRSSGSFGFKVDQQVDRRSFVFVATFEETLKGTKAVSFSEIMASFLMETILYESYTQSLTQKASFETTIVHGARLRYFRRSINYNVQDSRIDDELFESFQKGLGASIKTDKSARSFFNVLLEEIGRSQQDVHLVKCGFSSGTTAVHTLLEQSKFQEAIELASTVRRFTKAHQGYHIQENINSGFMIALYLAGRGARRCPDQKLWQQQLDLSKTFVEEILEASRETNVDFTKMEIPQLNELVGLMGEVQNFQDLEWLLTQLWESRHTQAWSSTTTPWIGRRLVEVRFSHGSRDAAISLLEDICYNLRRVWGALDPTTLQMDTLRSELYSTAGLYTKAMRVHEEILQQIVGDENGDVTVEAASQTARIHLDLLKRAHQRLGGWDKNASVYEDLYDNLVDQFRDEKIWTEVQPIKKWPSKATSANDGVGVFKQPHNWEFLEPKHGAKPHQNYLRRVSGLQRWDSGYKTGGGSKRIKSGLFPFVEVN